MKKLFLIFVSSVLICGLQAATVIFQFQTPFGQSSTPAVSLTPLSVPLWQSNTLVLSGMTTFRYPTNGYAVDAYGNTNFWGWTNNGSVYQLVLPLSAGGYSSQVQGFPRAWGLTVADSQNTFYASDLSSNTIVLSPSPVYLAFSNVVSWGFLTNNATGVTLAGAFSGNGAGLTNLSSSVNTNGLVPQNGTATNVTQNIGSGTTLVVYGTNAAGAEIVVSNTAAGGWAGLTAQADNGNFTTNYAGLYVNNSRFVPGAGYVGSTNDAVLESAVSGNFYFDVIGNNSHLYLTSRGTTNGTVATNADITSTYANFKVPLQVNGVNVLTNASTLTYGQLATITNAVTNNFTGWLVDPSSTNWQGLFIALGNGETAFYTNTGAAVTNYLLQNTNVGSLRFTQVGGTNVFYNSFVGTLARWTLVCSTGAADNATYRFGFADASDPTTNRTPSMGIKFPAIPIYIAQASYRSYPATNSFYTGTFFGNGAGVKVRSDALVPPTISTNHSGSSGTAVASLGDSINAGIGTSPATNYVRMVYIWVTNAETATGLAASQESNNGNAGYTANYYSTNGSYALGKYAIIEAGLNDLRWQQWIGGLSPAQVCINAQSNLIKFSITQGARKVVLPTVWPWLASTNWDAFAGAANNSLGQQTNVAPWSASVILTNANPTNFFGYQSWVRQVTEWQLSQATNGNVIVCDSRLIPITQANGTLFDGVHPNNFGHIIIGTWMVGCIQLHEAAGQILSLPRLDWRWLAATNNPAAGNAYRFDGTNNYWAN